MAYGGNTDPLTTGTDQATQQQPTQTQQQQQHHPRRTRKRCLADSHGDDVSKRDDGGDEAELRREAKRLRDSMDDNVLSRAHPHGVKPLGNIYIDETPSCREEGLGIFRFLSDELLITVLEMMEADVLSVLGATSKAMYAFTRHDELWKSLTVRDFASSGFAFKGSWRGTYSTSCVARRRFATADAEAAATTATTTGTTSSPSSAAPNANVHAYIANPPITVRGLYSDELFRPWHCATLEFDPIWGSTDNIDRRSSLSLADFIREYERPNRPVIITDAVTQWPAYAKWDKEYLLGLCGDVPFEAGPVHIRLADYWDYMTATREESPVYLFDPRFAEKVPQLGADYSVPEYFGEDLLSLAGADRPDFRWLIIGPAKSGSVFHIDPNSTSAWNAVVRGSKKWIMYPPECVPPGVIPSCDGSEVTSPVSLAEWFLSFYAQTRYGGTAQRPIECVCRAGELLFVPRGWWHLVINMEDSVAITQNYVSSQNIVHVLDFMQNKPTQVSGVPRDMRFRMGDILEARHRSAFPGRLDAIREEDKAHALRTEKHRPISLWDSITDGVASSDSDAKKETASFSFGFS